MAAAPGNQYALGNKGGRPRTVSPPPEECEALGKEMVEWVIANKPTHLSEWFSIHMMFTWKMWNTMCETKEFLPYYEIALSLVAKFSRDGTLDKSIAQRFLSMYHRDLKQEERDKAKFEAEISAQIKALMDKTGEAQFASQFEAIVKQLSDYQARKIDDTSISTDSKSE